MPHGTTSSLPVWKLDAIYTSFDAPEYRRDQDRLKERVRALLVMLEPALFSKTQGTADRPAGTERCQTLLGGAVSDTAEKRCQTLSGGKVPDTAEKWCQTLSGGKVPDTAEKWCQTLSGGKVPDTAERCQTPCEGVVSD
ncbi:MAG: hypothetical protein LBS86_04705, partial [Treponema sp.]|nr:hypothetical protein [Treponema sp.]